MLRARSCLIQYLPKVAYRNPGSRSCYPFVIRFSCGYVVPRIQAFFKPLLLADKRIDSVGGFADKASVDSPVACVSVRLIECFTKTGDDSFEIVRHHASPSRPQLRQ